MDQCSLKDQVKETFSFFLQFLIFDTLPLNIWFKLRLYIKDVYRQYDIIHFFQIWPYWLPNVGFSQVIS